MQFSHLDIVTISEAWILLTDNADVDYHQTQLWND